MALREILARFGFQIDQRGLKKAETGIAGVVGSMRAFGAAIAGSVVVRGIANFVDGIVTAGDELGKTAKQLGLSTTELQRWQVAAQLSGASTKELQVGVRTLAKNALLAEQGSKQAADAYKSLGVEVTDASGKLKDTSTLFRETGLALGKLENNTERTALAQQLLGRSGVKLIPLFEKGGDALDELLGKLEEYGGGIGPEAVKLSEDAADNFLFFEIATESLKSQLAVSFLPILNQVVGGLSKLIGWVAKATEGTSVFKSLLVSLGLVIGKIAIAKFGASFLRLGRAAILPLLKFALLFLVIDDLIALFEGRGSVIGTFIDKIFGKGSAKALIDGIKGVGSALADLIKTGDWDAFDAKLEDIFGPPGMALVEGIVQIGQEFGQAWDLLVEDVGAGVDSALEAVGNFFSGLGTSIKNAVKDLAQGAADLASAIVDGLVEGIKEGAAAIVKALGDVVQGGIDAAKKKLGIKSPSRVAGEELGEPLVMGVPFGALRAARAAAQRTASALAMASGLTSPTAISAPARAPTAPATGGAGGVVFKSDIALTVNGGSASDPQIQKLRQGLRSDLRENRRATLNALTQRTEVPA